MSKKSRQKFKYLDNEKSFSGEIKSISRACIEVNNFLEGENPTLQLVLSITYRVTDSLYVA